MSSEHVDIVKMLIEIHEKLASIETKMDVYNGLLAEHAHRCDVLEDDNKLRSKELDLRIASLEEPAKIRAKIIKKITIIGGALSAVASAAYYLRSLIK